MSLKDVDFKIAYYVPEDDVVNDFYIPILKETYNYDRAVGYFTSDALIEFSRGICELVKKGGTIRLIVSPKLTKEDFVEINKGYELRKEVEVEIIEKNLTNNMLEYENYFDKARLSLIADLIMRGVLDVEIAFSWSKNGLELFHVKYGIFYDEEGNYVATNGSMNETESGLFLNYENFDVYSSWEEPKRAKEKKQRFVNVWYGNDSYCIVYPFPEAAKKRLLNYYDGNPNYNIDEEEKRYSERLKQEARRLKLLEDGKKIYGITRPKDLNEEDFRPYQLSAIKKWRSNEHNFRGIYDMATGTGKTYTAIGSIIELLKEKGGCGIIISVPQKYLANQWNDELKKFNIKTILGHSDSYEKKWKKYFPDYVKAYSRGDIPYFCLVTTNASFSKDYIQNPLSRCKKPLLLIADEAHHFGSYSLRKLLDDKFIYRLALSATLDRHYDEDGTRALYNYFGDKCISYSLKTAIQEGYLTSYFYHPIPVYLDEQELEEYNRISRRINRIIKFDENGEPIIDEYCKLLLVERSRIIAGAKNKINELKSQIQPYINDYHQLIYCGATNYYDFEKDDNNKDNEKDLKQIDKVKDVLGNELGMRIREFTSRVSSYQRNSIIKESKEDESINAIVAIKCLDEGIDIPNIQRAFILASSTNPNEYIQRLGRILRKAPNKTYSYVYDFITLPRNLNKISKTDDIDFDINLVKRETKRIEDFCKNCENPSESQKLIDKLIDIYGIEILAEGNLRDYE